MENNTEVRVPSTKEIWSMLGRMLDKNASDLTDTMGYYNTDNTTYNIEDIAPMKENCEKILLAVNDIYEDIIEMETSIRGINSRATQSPEEYFILQGEHEKLEKNSL